MNTLGSACKNFEEDLVLYYYGDCSEAERSRVENHLRECVSCHGFLEDLRRFLPHMARSKEFPQTFWDSYYTEMLEKLDAVEERRSWWTGLFSWIRPWTVPAFGTALVLILALALVFTKGMVPSAGHRAQEKVPGEILADASKLDFFKSMDLLESLQLLEALDGTKTDRDPVQSL